MQGEITLKVHDFSQIGPVLDGAVQDGIVDFRSLTYSLQDEEHAKENAVANAMKNAVGRATSALAQNNQKVGAIRYASLDVRQLVGVAQYYGNQVASLTESVVVSAERESRPSSGTPASAARAPAKNHSQRQRPGGIPDPINAAANRHQINPQKAMAYAMIYPEASKCGRGKSPPIRWGLAEGESGPVFCG